MKKIICILLTLLLLCACAPSTATSSSQFNGIMSVPLLSMISVDYSISVPGETPSSEPSTVTSSTNSSPVTKLDWESHLPNYPLQYTDPWRAPLAQLEDLQESPIRQKEDLLTEEDITELLKAMLPLGMFLCEHTTVCPLDWYRDENGNFSEENVVLYDEYWDWEHDFLRPVENELHSIENIKRLLQLVFTQEYLESTVYPIAFELSVDDKGEIDPPFYLEKDGVLLALTNENITATSVELEWQLDTLEIVSQSKNSILIEMKYLDVHDYGLSWIDWGKGKIRFVKEGGIWKFDSNVSNGYSWPPSGIIDMEELEIEYVEWLNLPDEYQGNR